MTIASRVQTTSALLAAICSAATLAPAPLRAQPIVPAADGTDTQVTRDGDRFTIEGGTPSQNNTNLFHSFEQFNLDPGQTADFRANPQLLNIFSRVVGGDPSVINGLLEITGGNPNLYLINPAGIIFGPQAQLNVPASFFATTANRIGFDNDTWLEVSNDNTYSDLIGTPNRFEFTLTDGGSIANAGDLAVPEGENLALLGASVMNSGTLSAPGGTIAIAAVPAENRVRLTQEGMLLSLEIEPTPDMRRSNSLSPLELPQLLTEGQTGVTHAQNVTLNEDGTVSLTGSGLNVPVTEGVALISGSLSVATPETSDRRAPTPPPRVQIFGSKIGISDATIDASSTNGGGIIQIGGDFPGETRVPEAQRTFISADTTLRANDLGSDTSSETPTEGGRVLVWADEVTAFNGAIEARGSELSNSNGGWVEVSGKQYLIFNGTVDVSAPNGSWGTLLIDPINILISNDTSTPGVETSLPEIFAGDFSAEDTLTINAATLENQAGNIVLEATNDITIDNGVSLNFVPAEGSITFRADAGTADGVGSFSMDPKETIAAPGRNLSIFGASITVGTLDTSADGNGGAISLIASDALTVGELISKSTNSGNAGNITLTIEGSGDIDVNSATIDASSESGDGGAISISTTDGNITTDNLNSAALNAGNAGEITLTVEGTGDIDTHPSTVNASSESGNGGAISISTTDGNITTGDLNSAALNAGNAGDIAVTIAGSGNIDTHPSTVNASSESGNGGAISLSTADGNLVIRDLNSSASNAGNGGDITLSVGGSGSIDSHPGTLDSTSDSGNGGTVDVTTRGGDVTTGDLDSAGSNSTVGAIAIDASSGTVTIQGTVNTIDLTVRANGIGFKGGDGSIQGTGNLVLEPGVPELDIGLSSSSNGNPTLNLGDRDLGAIAEGFSLITIGRPDGTGTLSLHENATFNAPVTLAGGTTLIGPNRDTTWTLSGTNAGTLSGYPNGLNFENIENLTGGDANDTYVFSDGASLSGIIDARGGTDTLDYSNYTTAVSINLDDNTATGTAGVFNIETAIEPPVSTSPTSPEDSSDPEPTEDTDSPTEDTDSPTEDTDSPTEDTDSPTEENRTPTEENRTPTEDTSTPTEDNAIDSPSAREDDRNSGAETPSSDNSETPPSNGEATASPSLPPLPADPPPTPVESAPIPIDNSTPSATPNPSPQPSAISQTPETPGTENTPTSPQPSAISQMPEAPGTENTPTNSQSPAIAQMPETPGTENTTASSETPAIDQMPETSSPAIAQTPETPGTENTPTNSQSPAIAQTPETPGTENTTASSETPAIDQTPAIAPESVTPDLPSPAVSDAPSIPSTLPTALVVTPIQLNAEDREVTLLPTDIGSGLGRPSPSEQVDSPASEENSTNGSPEGTPPISNPGSPTGLEGEEAIALPSGISSSSARASNPSESANVVTPNVEVNISETAASSTAVGSQNSTSARTMPSSNGGGNRTMPSAQAAQEAIGENAIGDTSASPVSDPLAQEQMVQVASPNEVSTLLDRGEISRAVEVGDRLFSEEFQTHLGVSSTVPYLSFSQIQNKQRQMGITRGTRSALVYLFLRDQQLDLVLVPSEGEPIYKSISSVSKEALRQQVIRFQQEIANPTKRRTTSYLASSQQLYQWLIAPLEPDLQRLEIETLIWSVDAGLRTVPIAALHDGERFLVEKYNLSVVPSLHLTQITHGNVTDASVLAMGLSEFPDKYPLPAVPLEVETIVDKLWPGKAFLNDESTLENLKRQRQEGEFGIIHIATHGQFQSGDEDNSYLQLWDRQISLDVMREFEWNDPPVELLVLSACRTAIGDVEAEYGFAGLAVQTGVKSALASLWYANDIATVGLMSEFYQHLRGTPLKAAALRQAQIAMIRGELRVVNNSVSGSFGEIALPADMKWSGDRELSHPYYWAGFTMIGSPW
ncbi:CHAT domain-containing protein [Phormidium sp. CCY1219]|uniref:CHAT domain-containing protein n=1 Tax=Phormidium sp. CCY1219 TaxID=2886104 RepID=UPI002D1E6947|nr:CHAT domain-containing protein [Phormidium sp. CCY1219]MEB3831914.1 CHAT domain-containing protein [Phormidium sp. CCY1219]